MYETEAAEGGGGGRGGADAAEVSSTAKSVSEGGTVPRRRRFSDRVPQNTRGRVSLPRQQPLSTGFFRDK